MTPAMRAVRILAALLSTAALSAPLAAFAQQAPAANEIDTPYPYGVGIGPVSYHHWH